MDVQEKESGHIVVKYKKGDDLIISTISPADWDKAEKHGVTETASKLWTKSLIKSFCEKKILSIKGDSELDKSRKDYFNSILNEL